MAVDEIDKYLHKKCSPSTHKNSKKGKGEEIKDIQDFSLLIDAPFEDDISIIESQRAKKTYKEWKHSSQRKNEFNLTVIE